MTDDLDDRRAALKTVPVPDASARARALALAMENFDRLQGSASAIRPDEDRPQPAAPLNGVRKMLTFLTSRPALAATTSIAALMIGVAVILPVANIRIGQAPLKLRKAESPIVGSQTVPEGKSATLAETREAPVDLVLKASPDVATPETTVAEAPAVIPPESNGLHE